MATSARRAPRRFRCKSAMSRIQATFEKLSQGGRKALIPFVTAGDPDPGVTVPLMHALVEAGADVIELGVPFSDPMADGPVIQRANDRALRHGIGLDRVLAFVREFRSADQRTPVVLMGYANPIEAMGAARFVEEAGRAGVDGVLVVDYPPEECESFAALVRGHGMDLIFLLAPTSSDARIAQVARLASGYLYYVSLKGVTGAGHLDLAEVAQKIPRIRRETQAAGGRRLRHPRRGYGKGGGTGGRCGGHRQRHHSANGSRPVGAAGAVRRQVHAGYTRGAGRKMSWLQKLLPPKIKRSVGPSKRAVPEGLWIKCASCDAVLYATDLEKNLNVCPKCSHHKRLVCARAHRRAARSRRALRDRRRSAAG